MPNKKWCIILLPNSSFKSQTISLLKKIVTVDFFFFNICIVICCEYTNFDANLTSVYELIAVLMETAARMTFQNFSQFWIWIKLVVEYMNAPIYLRKYRTKILSTFRNYTKHIINCINSICFAYFFLALSPSVTY